MQNTDTSEKILNHLQKKLNAGSDTPIYLQIQNSLEQMIKEKDLKPGLKLPKETAISKKLGVNTRTVNKALSALGNRGVIKRIKRAGSFVGKIVLRTATFGLYYPVSDNPRMLKVAEYLQSYLDSFEIDLKIITYTEDHFKHNDPLEEMRARNLDGILIAISPLQPVINAVKKLESASFPVIRFSERAPGLKSPAVKNDLPGAVEMAVHYLQKIGHSNIGFAGSFHVDEVLSAYKSAIARKIDKGIYIDVDPDNWTRSTNWKISGFLRENVKRITALVVTSPTIVPEIILQTSKQGIEIPEDLSILSVYDSKELEIITPGITAIRPRLEILAEEAGKLLIRAFHGEKLDRELKKIPFELIERHSVRHIEKGGPPEV